MADYKQDNHYLKQDEFFHELIDCWINDQQISHKLSMMFQLLGEKNSNHRYFVRYYHIKEDIISQSVLACVGGFYKFRPYKDKQRSLEWLQTPHPIQYDYKIHNNPHAFFTTCIMNSLFGYLKTEYNFVNAVNATRVREGMDPSFGYEDMMKEKERRKREAREMEIEDEESLFGEETIETMQLWDDYSGDMGLREGDVERVEGEEGETHGW